MSISGLLPIVPMEIPQRHSPPLTWGVTGASSALDYPLERRNHPSPSRAWRAPESRSGIGERAGKTLGCCFMGGMRHSCHSRAGYSSTSAATTLSSKRRCLGMLAPLAPSWGPRRPPPARYGARPGFQPRLRETPVLSARSSPRNPARAGATMAGVGSAGAGRTSSMTARAQASRGEDSPPRAGGLYPRCARRAGGVPGAGGSSGDRNRCCNPDIAPLPPRAGQARRRPSPLPPQAMASSPKAAAGGGGTPPRAGIPPAGAGSTLPGTIPTTSAPASGAPGPRSPAGPPPRT